MSFFSKNKYNSDSQSIASQGGPSGFFGSNNAKPFTPTQHPKGVAPKAFSFTKKPKVMSNETPIQQKSLTEFDQGVSSDVSRKLSLTASPSSPDLNTKTTDINRCDGEKDSSENCINTVLDIRADELLVEPDSHGKRSFPNFNGSKMDDRVCFEFKEQHQSDSSEKRGPSPSSPQQNISCESNELLTVMDIDTDNSYDHSIENRPVSQYDHNSSETHQLNSGNHHGVKTNVDEDRQLHHLSYSEDSSRTTVYDNFDLTSGGEAETGDNYYQLFMTQGTHDTTPKENSHQIRPDSDEQKQSTEAPTRIAQDCLQPQQGNFGMNHQNGIQKMKEPGEDKKERLRQQPPGTREHSNFQQLQSDPTTRRQANVTPLLSTHGQVEQPNFHVNVRGIESQIISDQSSLVNQQQQETGSLTQAPTSTFAQKRSANSPQINLGAGNTLKSQQLPSSTVLSSKPPKQTSPLLLQETYPVKARMMTTIDERQATSHLPSDTIIQQLSKRSRLCETKNDFPSESRKLLFDIKGYRDQLIELDRSGLEVMLAVTKSHSSAIEQISKLQIVAKEIEELSLIEEQFKVFISDDIDSFDFASLTLVPSSPEVLSRQDHEVVETESTSLLLDEHDSISSSTTQNGDGVPDCSIKESTNIAVVAAKLQDQDHHKQDNEKIDERSPHVREPSYNCDLDQEVDQLRNDDVSNLNKIDEDNLSVQQKQCTAESEMKLEEEINEAPDN